MVVVDPAPKVEKALAHAAEPREAPFADAALSSSGVKVEVPLPAGAAYAEPPRGSLSKEESISNPPTSLSMKDCDKKISVEELHNMHSKILFEAPAAVIIGQAEKSICQRMIPLLFDERSFLSYGECKRYILITNGTIFVYADVTDPSPLYIIELADLIPKEEDSNNPEFYSHTISPEANTGLPFQNKSKESLSTVLLKKGKAIEFQFAFDKSEAGSDAAEKFITAVMSSKNDCKK